MAALEKHYTVSEVALMWGLSDDTVRTLFRNHPCVLKIASPELVRKKKRGYCILRIPESVVQKVHAERCRG